MKKFKEQCIVPVDIVTVSECYNEEELLVLSSFSQQCQFNKDTGIVIDIKVTPNSKKVTIKIDSKIFEVGWKAVQNKTLRITKRLLHLQVIPFDFFIGLLLSNKRRFEKLVFDKQHELYKNPAQFIHTYLGKEPLRIIYTRSIWVVTEANEIILLEIGDMFQFEKKYYMVVHVDQNEIIGREFCTLSELLNIAEYEEFLMEELRLDLLQKNPYFQDKVLVKMPSPEDFKTFDCNRDKFISKIFVKDLDINGSYQSLKNNEFWFFGWFRSKQDFYEGISLELLKKRIIRNLNVNFPTTYYDESDKTLLLPVKMWSDAASPFKFNFNASQS